MFEFVRAHNKLFQLLLVILVFPSFVFFGVQGYSRFNDDSAVPVAKVDGRNITRADWDRSHQQVVERLRRQNPKADLSSLDSPAARDETLQDLVRERVLMAAAIGQHLMPSDERLSRIFRADPQFAAVRNPDGTVSRDFLAAQGLSSEAFAQQLRLDIGMRQVLGGVSSSSLMSKASFDASLEALLQRRAVQWQRFDAKSYAAGIKATDEDLQAYLKANEARFRTLEEASVEYVVLDLEGLKASVQVSEDELRRYYNENEARYTGAQERRASHILISAGKDLPAPDRQKARDRAQELLEQARKAPAAFAELARKHSQDPGSAGQGGDLGFFSRGAMVKPFEDAVFAMKAGEIAPVVESEFGFHIIQLTGVRGGDKKAFDAVRAEIDAEVRRQLAQRRYAEAAEQFTNTVYEQADSLQPVIDRLKLERRTGTVTRQPGPQSSGVLTSPKLIAAVFSDDALRLKRNTQAIDLGNSRLVAARVTDHRPPRVPALAEVGEAVRAAFVSQKSAELARQAGEARLAAIKGDATAALAASGIVSRTDAAGLPRKVVEAVLRAPVDTLPAVVGVALGEEGYAVARITQVLAPEVPAGLSDLMKAQVAQAWGSAESWAYYEALKARAKAQILAPAAAAAAPASGASKPQ